LCVAAALPAAAQPKLLVNAAVDTRSAASGLEPQFRTLVAAPAGPEGATWIGYSIPAVKKFGLGCEYSDSSGMNAGVVHLEPPDHAVILFRVAANAVERIRTLSADCQIDAGGMPVHWLNDVPPADSVALLATFAGGQQSTASSALRAIAWHADPAAATLLAGLARDSRDQRLQRRAIAELGSLPDGHGVDPLIELVKTAKTPEIRKAAMTALSHTHDPRATAFFEEVLKR
jgi:hypothetical protein